MCPVPGNPTHRAAGLSWMDLDGIELISRYLNHGEAVGCYWSLMASMTSMRLFLMVFR